MSNEKSPSWIVDFFSPFEVREKFVGHAGVSNGFSPSGSVNVSLTMWPFMKRLSMHGWTQMDFFPMERIRRSEFWAEDCCRISTKGGFGDVGMEFPAEAFKKIFLIKLDNLSHFVFSLVLIIDFSLVIMVVLMSGVLEVGDVFFAVFKPVWRRLFFKLSNF